MDNQKDKCPTIGIPRALLYHRFETLWKTYFETLGVTIMVSPPTNREILESGAALAIDETCLSAKIYLGHVQTLIGKCDYIFIPRYSNLGRQEAFCTRFEGIYDQTRNILSAKNVRRRRHTHSLDSPSGSASKKPGALMKPPLKRTQRNGKHVCKRRRKRIKSQV